MAAIAIVGLLSIRPTVRILGWRRASREDPAYAVPDAELATVRSALHRQLAVFMLIPAFAALMVRGIGL